MPSLSTQLSSSSSSFPTSRSALHEETCDILQTMMKQEVRSYPPLPKLVCTRKDPWRRLMINWMYKIVDVFELSDHIVQVAVYYLDTCVAKNLVQSPHDYKLLSLTALQLAIKVYDVKLFPIQQLLALSHTKLTVEQVSVMERRIMSALHWRLHPPTLDCFVSRYCTIMATTSSCKTRPMANTNNWLCRVEEEALDMSRTMMMHESFRPYRRSVVAYVAMIVSMNRILEEERHGIGMMKAFKKEIIRLTNIGDLSEDFVGSVSELVVHIDDIDGSLEPSTVTKNNRSSTPTAKRWNDNGGSSSPRHVVESIS